MHKWVPCGFALSISHVPIQDLPSATAIGPEAKCYQQHYFLSRFLLTLALAFVQLDGVRLGLQAQPNAIELYHRRHLADRVTVRELSQRLDLINALVDGA